MMKDLRHSIMTDVKELMDEDRKKFTKEIAFSIRSSIDDSMRETFSTHKLT